ncbi:MAG: type 4a pilus biogenesis protein PilO [Actinomycetota bacterium]
MRRQIVVAAVSILVIVALFFVLLLRPVSSKISEARDQVRAAKSEETSLRLQIRALEAARRDAPAVQARLAKFDLLLPKTADLPVFIRQVQEAANQSGVDLSSIAPSPPAPLSTGQGADPALAGRGVFTLNVVLQVSGGFFRIESFLRRLESLQRVSVVNNLAITPLADESGLDLLQSTITMQMFIVNPNLPVPGQTPAPGASPTPTGGGGGGPATPAPTSS